MTTHSSKAPKQTWAKKKQEDILAEEPQEEEEEMEDFLHDDLDFTSQKLDFDDFKELLKESQDHEMVRELLQKGVDLRQYNNEIEQQLNVEEMGIIPEYYKERDVFATLYTRVVACEGTLTKFEELLIKFQQDLKEISTEIKTLQNDTVTKNLKVSNRKALKSKLTKFLEEVWIPADLVKILSDGEINEHFLQALKSFNKKVGYVETQRSTEIAAYKDLDPQMRKLLLKSVTRIFDYLNTQISAIKSFATLHSRQKEMTHFGFLFQFLFKHSSQAAGDIKNLYYEAVEKFYYAYYKNYMSILSRYEFEIAGKNDLLGTEDSKLKSFFTSKVSKVNVKSSVFTLGARSQVLTEIEMPPINPPAQNAAPVLNSQISGQTKYSYDYLFRSYLCLLVDMYNTESMFVRDFFLAEDDVSAPVFSRLITIISESLAMFVSECYDSVGLLVVLCLIYSYQELIPNQKSAIYAFTQRAAGLVFSRFSAVFDMNVESLKNANIRDLGPIEITPHYVTRRYSELASSIHKLMGPLPDNERDRLLICTKKLRDAMNKLLLKMAEEFKDRQDKIVFLINNYDLILSIIAVKDRGINAEDIAYTQKQLDSISAAFVNDQIAKYSFFGLMANFVKEIGPLVDASPNPEEISHPKFNIDVVETLLKEFGNNWRRGIDLMHVTILKLFPNFNNGMSLFQIVLEEIFSNYKQFSLIINKCFKQLRSSKHFVSETEISYEMKNKYKTLPGLS